MEARGGFDAFVWDYFDGRPLQNRFRTQAEVPPKTPLSERMSKDMKKAGFKFCGPTIVYAWLEATGVVNDHLIGCPRHAEVVLLARA